MLLGISATPRAAMQLHHQARCAAGQQCTPRCHVGLAVAPRSAEKLRRDPMRQQAGRPAGEVVSAAALHLGQSLVTQPWANLWSFVEVLRP